jgi:hypothetical protein
MHDFNYQDTSCDLTNFEKYNLSIQLALDGFSLLIQDPDNKEILLLDHTTLQLSGVSGLLRKSGELLAAKNISGNKFNNVVVFPESRLAKLVPAEIQTEKYLRNLFNLSSRDFKSLSFISSEQDNRYHSVFGCHTEIPDMFTSLFPGCMFQHETVPLINRNRMHIPEEQTILKCHFHSGYFYTAAMKGSEIRFFNNFAYASAEDVLYYLTAIAGTLDETAPIAELSGHIMPDSPLVKLLNSHFGETCFVPFHNVTSLKNKLQDFGLHRVAPLLSHAGL